MSTKQHNTAPAEPARRYEGANIPMRVIRRFARQVAERFQPDKIILFGSYAYGTPHADSDVDILVVMPAGNYLSQAYRIRLAVPAPFPMDLLVLTPAAMKWRLKDGESFLTEIVSKGKVLYENQNQTRRADLLAFPRSRTARKVHPPSPGSGPEPLMKRTTAEWVRKAEADYVAAKQTSRSKIPLHDVVCFHCQQCVEKYLKAMLEELALAVPRTHELDHLETRLLPTYPSLRSFHRGFDFLSDFAVETRYPGKRTRKRQAVAALRWAGRVRQAARSLLGIRPRRRKKSP